MKTNDSDSLSSGSESNEKDITGEEDSKGLMGLSFPLRSLLFAKLSKIAYSDNLNEVKKEVQELGFEDVEFYNKKGAQAYRFQSKEDMVIVCRGTEKSVNDIVADLKTFPVPSDTVGRVHRGFKSEVDELWPRVLEDITHKHNTHKNFWFCGHSLGGAMSTIMASRAYYENSIPNPKELYTFGSPRVGWPAFVDTLKTPHHRWVNNNDIVTTVPPWFFGYVHDGQEHYFNAYGNVREMTWWQMIKDKVRGRWMGIKTVKIDRLSDHSILNYIAHLEMYASGEEYSQE